MPQSLHISMHPYQNCLSYGVEILTTNPRVEEFGPQSSYLFSMINPLSKSVWSVACSRR